MRTDQLRTERTVKVFKEGVASGVGKGVGWGIGKNNYIHTMMYP